MGYKEKIKSYAEGKLEGKEKETIESDIDRQRAIGEYLEESMDSGIFEESKGADVRTAGEDGELSKLVQQAVSRKLKRFGIWTGAIVLAIALFLTFGLSPLVDAMYYDPALKMKDGQHNVIDLPLSVYSELHCPNKRFISSSIDSKGFGNYDLKLLYLYTDPLGSGIYYPKINQGKFTDDDTRWRNPNSNLYFSSEWPGDDYGDSDIISELEKLPETCVVTACVSFKEDAGLSYVRSMSSEAVRVTYVPIRVADIGEWTTDLLFGIAPYDAGTYIEDQYYDYVSYPHLGRAYLSYDQWISPDIPDTVWEKHFTSMLKFMADQKDINYAMDNDAALYKDTLNYVEENGIKAYGVLVTASVDEILRLRNEKNVESISIEAIELSKYGR